jgi:hypothetical protein
MVTAAGATAGVTKAEDEEEVLSRGSAEDEMADAEEAARTGVKLAEDEADGVELSVKEIVNVVDGCAMTRAAGSVVNGDTTAGVVVADVKFETSALISTELVGDVVAAPGTNALILTKLVEDVVATGVAVVVVDDTTGVTATLISVPTGHHVGTSEALEEGLMVTLMRGAESGDEGVWKGRTLMEEGACFCTGRTR